MLQVHVYGDRSRLYETRSAILNIIGKYNGTCKKKIRQNVYYGLGTIL